MYFFKGACSKPRESAARRKKAQIQPKIAFSAE
jgi:hypothetical protein